MWINIFNVSAALTLFKRPIHGHQQKKVFDTTPISLFIPTKDSPYIWGINDYYITEFTYFQQQFLISKPYTSYLCIIDRLVKSNVKKYTRSVTL